MRLAKRKKPRLVQYDLFGNPIEEGSTRDARSLMAFDFETNAVRIIMVRGEPWWVLADVARVLRYKHVPHAARILRDKQKGVQKVDTPGGVQEMAVVNEGGLFRLIMRSGRPEAERFQDWVTDEVLPSIRRTGSYTVHRTSRVSQVARRKKIDLETAKVRCDQIDINKASNSRLASEKAVPRDFQEYHNGFYRGQFDGKDAAELRVILGRRPHETPLDHMERLVLSINHHAKAATDRQIDEAKKAGRPLSLPEQARLAETNARYFSKVTLEQLGEGYAYGLTHDPKRGLILDVVRMPQLIAS